MSNDELDDLDLSAWTAPPPPAGLADAVIASATRTNEAIAMTTRRRTRRTAIVGGVVATALAASVALWLELRPTTELPTTDVVLGADSPRTIEFGGVKGRLDRGTAVHVRRTGNNVRIEQSGGATWTVAPQDHLVIGAGQSASIEATGASLRVEATMNLADKRLIGMTVLTSAAIAALTATVYEGFIKAKSDDKPVVMLYPGSEVSIGSLKSLEIEVGNLKERIRAPKAGEPTSHADLAIAAGESVSIHVPNGPVTVEVQARCGMVVMYLGGSDARSGEPIPDGTGTTYTFGPGAHSYTSTCPGGRAETGTITVDTLDGHGPIDGRTNARVFSPNESVFPMGMDSLHMFGDVRNDAVVSVGNRILPLGPPDDGSTLPTFKVDIPWKGVPEAGVVRVSDDTGIHFYVLRPRMIHCDAPTAIRDGIALEAAGKHKQAVGQFVVAQACEGSEHTAELGFVAACNDGNVKASKLFWRAIDAKQHDRLVQVCLRNHITAEMLNGTSCNSGDELTSGKELEAAGDHAMALRHFEAAYQCNPERAALAMMYMAACNSGNVPKARTYWRRMTPGDQSQYEDMCVRNHITREQLDAP
jgi:hypothetical protein